MDVQEHSDRLAVSQKEILEFSVMKDAMEDECGKDAQTLLSKHAASQ
jgi:hypothetical protein